MRIPWYISIPVCLFFTIVLFFVFSNKDKSTTANPSANTNTSTQTVTSVPSTGSVGEVVRATEDINAGIEEDEKVITMEDMLPPAFHQLMESTDAGTTPSLEQFHGVSEQAQHYTHLAQVLYERKNPILAQLAWERAIDSCDASTDDLQESYEFIAELRRHAPLWQPDASLRTIVNIHLSVSSTMSAKAQKLRKTLQATLFSASSGLIAANIHIQTLPPRDGLPPLPCSVSLSGASQAKTRPVTFIPKSPDELEQQIYFAIYHSIVNRLREKTDLTTPPVISDISTARDALFVCITRLSYRTAAQSL